MNESALWTSIELYHVAVSGLFLIGFYVMIDSQNLIRKVIGLNLLQIAVLLLLVSTGYIAGGSPPVLTLDGPYANPLPHALVLTAIVVSISLIALALALVIRLSAEFETTDVAEIERAIAADKEENDD